MTKMRWCHREVADEEEKRRKKRKSKKGEDEASALLEDTRFKALFQNKDFQIDEKSDELTRNSPARRATSKCIMIRDAPFGRFFRPISGLPDSGGGLLWRKRVFTINGCLKKGVVFRDTKVGLNRLISCPNLPLQSVPKDWSTHKISGFPEKAHL